MGKTEPVDVAQTAFLEAFRLKLREIQAGRTDEQMARLLKLPRDRYSKIKNRGDKFPMSLLPRLCDIGATGMEALFEELQTTAASIEKRKSRSERVA